MKGATSSRKVVPVANKFAILEETMEDMDQNQQATVMKEAGEVQIRSSTTKLNHKAPIFNPSA